MSYELNLEIAEDSPEGRNIETTAFEERLTREDAARRILQTPSHTSNGKSTSSASQIIGSFKSPEDCALIDDAMSIVIEDRTRRNALAAQ